MSKENLERATARLIQQIKDCGQSVINNAESIVGNYDYQTDLSIHITIPMRGAMPEINVDTTFIPEDCCGVSYCEAAHDEVYDEIVRKINEELEEIERLEIDAEEFAKQAAQYVKKELDRMNHD